MTAFLANWQQSDAKVFELAGVEPNPRIETVRKGVEICKKRRLIFSWLLEAEV